MKVAGATAAAAVLPGAYIAAESSDQATPETLVKKLYESLSESQKKDVAFAWDHQDRSAACSARASRTTGTSRSRRSRSDFFTKDQQEICPRHLQGHLPARLGQARSTSNCRTNANGWGDEQNIAIFGKPGEASSSSS